uniref:Uncharacterized protein n=1 Tax=Phasianus colchicus TaxID=9054 RepID=A0A669Q639_PHACC
MCNIIYIYHLQAIYKDVNSKAYLLRLSSFLIYIYTFLTVVLFWSCFTQKKKVLSDSSEIFCHC